MRHGVNLSEPLFSESESQPFKALNFSAGLHGMHLATYILEIETRVVLIVFNRSGIEI